MEILKFTLSGKHAMFKKPDVNSVCYYTYGQIHKPALLGLFGAVLGYAGYNGMKKNDVFPQYYEKLHHLKISIVPGAEKGCFSRKTVGFNNSVGYASREQGGNLIVKEQWLEEPSWDIYVQTDNEEARRLTDAVTQQKCVYIPYLGKNDHSADLTSVSVEEGDIFEGESVLNCLFPKCMAEINQDPFAMVENSFKYEEALPVGLEEQTNQYILEKFVYTNLELLGVRETIWNVGGRKLIFY